MTPASTTDDSLPFDNLPALVAAQARARPDATALVVGPQRLSYAELNALADRVAASLQRDGARPQEVVAVCGGSSVEYIALFLGALRAGLAVAPLAPGATAAHRPQPEHVCPRATRASAGDAALPVIGTPSRTDR